MEDVVLVQPGYTSAVDILNPGGPEYRILIYANNDPTHRLGFEHRCKITDREDGPRQLILAPWLQEGHQVICWHPVTINPSILCSGCGTHGFIRDGLWVQA